MTSALSPPKPTFANGTVEALKWLALALMTLDHVNKYFYGDHLAWMFRCGRLVLPIFLAVLAYNLARPQAIERGIHIRTMKRMLLFGALATPPFIAIGSTILWGWWPLNVMFLLLAMTACIYLIDRGTLRHKATAVVVFLIGGALPEYWWPGIALGLCFWWYFRKPSWLAAIAVVLGTASLAVINGNYWALASLPLLWLATRIDIRVPRLRLAFYVYYPAHLAVIWLIKML